MSRDIGFYYLRDIYQIFYTGLDTLRAHSRKVNDTIKKQRN